MYSLYNSVNLLSPQNNSIEYTPSKYVQIGSKLDPISLYLSPVSCDSLVLQGLKCEWEQVC